MAVAGTVHFDRVQAAGWRGTAPRVDAPGVGHVEDPVSERE